MAKTKQTTTTAHHTRGRRPKDGERKAPNKARDGQHKSSRDGHDRSARGRQDRPGATHSASPRSDSPSARTDSSSSRSNSGSPREAQGEPLLEKFFFDQLKDIYYAEQKIAQPLPKMQEAATTDELKEAFEDHLFLTQRHIKRLEKVFESLGKKPEGKRCDAIEGIIKEAGTIIAETEEGTLTRDAALIIAAQKVEHYEIATYGGLLQLAITMGLYGAAEFLDRTLIEEEDTDWLLTDIAENDINLAAEQEGRTYSWQIETVEALV
jgi:ferritin-like metal-binding protein YciE